MSDNTEPLPVVVWPKGVWHCDLCGQLGAGGAQGFNEHYVGWHWEKDLDGLVIGACEAQ